MEFILGAGGKRIHEMRRRMDYVMGRGAVARTYFTEESGRLFQLPLTWYRQHGWDFSPGYELNNARFDRVMPDRCVACQCGARGPRAVRLSVTGPAECPGLIVENVPPRGVQIFEHDGTIVGALSAAEQTSLTWNLLNEAGAPVAGGLYLAVVHGRDPSGRTLPPQSFSFGIVRQRVQ